MINRLSFRAFAAMFFVLPLLNSSPSWAREKVDDLPILKEEVAIAPGATRRFEFGTVDQKNRVVTLEITSRIQSLTPLGSSLFMKVALNGREITPARGRLAQRLVNKPLTSPVTEGISALWFGAPKGWRVLFAPDFEAGKKAFYTGDPYTLIWDVTDLINPAAENRLDITNNADAGAIQASQSSGDLVLKALTVGSKEGHSPMMAPLVDSAPYINRGEPGAGIIPYEGEVLPGGGFVVKAGRRQWEIESAISYPNAGLNRLMPSAAVDNTGQDGWSISVKPAKNGGQVWALGPQYSVRRNVTFEAQAVRVQDTITNRTAQPLGLLVRHQTELKGLENPRIYLAGNPDPGVSDYTSPGNPSVVVQAADHQLGFFCEDDVFRNQARLFVDAGKASDESSAGIQTKMFRLAPGETYSLKWSLYLVGGNDYFDFINAVRRDWKSNITTVGAWYWGFYPDTILAKSDEQLREEFTRQGIKYVSCGGGWVDYGKDKKRIGFGSGVLDSYWDDYRKRLRDAAVKMRRAVPGVKVLAYYDAQRDTSVNFLEKLKGGELTSPNGAHHFTEWNYVFQRTYSGVPTLENTFGKAMLETADRYMDEMGMDGLYWDEMENTGYGSPLLTFNRGDGHSCVLDPVTYTITREVGNTSLISAEFRLEVVRRIQAKGGMVLGNGPATTRALQEAKFQHMIESQHNDYWTFEGLLQTPLGYLSRRSSFEDVRRVVGLGVLPVGTSTQYTHEFSKYLFPFTPIELHSGYLLGQERIVANHSGNYGWQGEKALVLVRHFDSQGVVSGKRFSTVIGSEGRTKVDLAISESVVLEKLPVTVNSGGVVSAEVRRYDESALEVKFEARRGAVWQLRDGKFAIRDGQIYQVECGGKSEKLTAQNGVLTVKLESVPDGTFRVSANR